MIAWAFRHVLIWVGVAAVVMVAISYGRDRLGAGVHNGNGTIAAPAGRVAPTRRTTAPQKSASRSMVLRAGEGGHFLVDASVDGAAVRFLVDTGATRVVLSPEDAKRVGFHLRDRQFTEKYRTAGGIVRAAPVTIRELRIGQLALREVEASVNEQPIGISLLGMSFLNRLDGYRVEGDKLILDW